MSEINCHGTEVHYEEVLPGWYLVRLLKTSTVPYMVGNFEIKNRDLGLTWSNDPSFVFGLEPIPGIPEDQWETTEDRFWDECLEVWNHYRDRLLGCTPEEGYSLIKGAIEVGYNYEEGRFHSWLCDRIYNHLQNNKGETFS